MDKSLSSGSFWGTGAVPHRMAPGVNQGKWREVPAESPTKGLCVRSACGRLLLTLAKSIPAAGETLRCPYVRAQKSRSWTHPGHQLIVSDLGVLWVTQYCHPPHSPEMGAKTVEVKPEAPKSPSMTQGTQREAQGPALTLSFLLQRPRCGWMCAGSAAALLDCRLALLQAPMAPAGPAWDASGTTVPHWCPYLKGKCGFSSVPH